MNKEYINKKINQIYKLLPMFENGENFLKNIDLIIYELRGIYNLKILKTEDEAILLEIMGKLNSLSEIDNHKLFKKNIFDTISLMKGLSPNEI